MPQKSKFQRYERNPSVPEAGRKIFYGKQYAGRGPDLEIKNLDTGKVELRSTNSYVEKMKDKEEYVKVFIGNFHTISTLSKPALGILDYIVSYRVEYHKDSFNFEKAHCAEIKDVSVRTVENGMYELLKKGIIYKSDEPWKYWLNINLIMKGDRTQVMKNNLELIGHE